VLLRPVQFWQGITLPLSYLPLGYESQHCDDIETHGRGRFYRKRKKNSAKRLENFHFKKKISIFEKIKQKL
jgi:hypothetical protein